MWEEGQEMENPIHCHDKTSGRLSKISLDSFRVGRKKAEKRGRDLRGDAV
jgi:hypothetical protein